MYGYNTAPVSSGGGGSSIVGYRNGQPIYSSTAMNGVDTSGMGTKAQQAQAGNNAGKAAAAAGDAAANNPAVNPNLGLPSLTAPKSNPGVPTYGSQSGPGIMEQYFGQRATGTDPGYEYTTGRGLKALDSSYAARGMYNSGAASQGASDYLANMGSQRMGQLDQLAGAADSSYNTRLATMLGLGTGLAGAEAGTAGAYDTGAANAMTNATNQGLSLGTQGAMIPYMANQNLMNNMFGAGSSILGAVL